MSGQQIGAAVGFVVGAYFGMPQLGAAIGGMIGGWISPTQVNGPRIGDGQSQTSAEGMPIPWILGTYGPIQGQIIQKSRRREVKKTDDGKGSGTEVNTYEAHQDFCILICESSEHRNSLMKGALFCLVDGKIVYDMRPESNFSAQNAKFLRNHTFYDGNESQMPDPTGEALVGVDNALAYRGVFTMWARDVNLSQYGDRIPVYQFVMVGEGESSETTTTEYVAPNYGRFQNSHWPLVDPESFYTFIGTRLAESGPVVTHAADTIQEIIDYFSQDPFLWDGPANEYIGYSASSPSPGTAGTPTTTGNFGIDISVAQPDITSNTSIVLAYNVTQPNESFDVSINDSSLCSAVDLQTETRPLYADRNGQLFGKFLRAQWGGAGPPNFINSQDCASIAITSYQPALYITVQSATSPPTPGYGDPCILGTPVLLPDDPSHTINCDGEVKPLATYSPVTNFALIGLQHQQIGTVLGQTVYLKKTLGPIIVAGSADDTQEFWEHEYASAVASGAPIAHDLTWPSDYPISTPYVFLAEYTEESLSTDSLGLDAAISLICVRGGLAEEDIDVLEMDQQMLGMGVLQPYNATEVLNTPLQAYLSFGSEYDAKLHFHKHGSDVDVVIDSQDFIEGSDETDESTRDQPTEYPRLLSVTAVDATQNYTARPQVARRISPDIRAIGEESMEVAVVLPPDYHAQLADIGLKVLWARAQGPRKFSVPFAQAATYLRLVPGMPFAIDGQRRMVDKLRIGDGELHIESVFDRQSAYTSDVQPTPALPPTAPPSNIGGVTLSAFLNAGVFRDQDDKVGIYVAVAGLMASWPGCSVQWKLDTDSDWQTAIASATQSSTIGYLTAPLPLASASGDDVTNTLSVSVHGGELNSITRLQYLNEQNPYAIITNATTGECEIGQFQDADQIEAGEYNLTTLVRGGLNTTPAGHAQGARFVFLDSVYFLEVPAAWIGRTINIRPVTFGTSPDNNASYSITFNPAVSQTEWQVGALEYTEAGGIVSLVITPRHRLGNDMTPIASSNFDGYQIEVQDAADQYNAFTSPTPNVTVDISTLTTPVTITVSALNRFTGSGPSKSIVIP